MDNKYNTYYDSSISVFLNEENDSILGELTYNHTSVNNTFDLNNFQCNAWIEEINILKDELVNFKDGYIALEYSIPRVEGRVDVIIIISGLVFVIECKIGAVYYTNDALGQVEKYAKLLHNYQAESKDILLIPIVLASEAYNYEFTEGYIEKGISSIQKCNKNSLNKILTKCIKYFPHHKLDPLSWINSDYKPTPTIIEAAKSLYENHTVKDIDSNEAEENLDKTIDAINKIINEAKTNNKKSICFITGVPGAGKTLVGLKIAVQHQNSDLSEPAVFLSGNGPLVKVLQEALARDQKEREGVRKQEAETATKEFIQLIHHFRKAYIDTSKKPPERVIIFDEAQRAWTKEKLEKKSPLKISEPEFLISVMERLDGWATMVCLIGGGQEINTGEVGLSEWFKSIKNKYRDWNIYISDKIDSEYLRSSSLDSSLNGLKYNKITELHLGVSRRSFRTEKVSELVKNILDFKLTDAKKLYSEVKDAYPIVLTRDIKAAKNWVKEMAEGPERYGKIASSGAKRLKDFGIWVESKIDPIAWFLNNTDDVRSSYFLEETATEFDIQGLELDWAIVGWDANLRINSQGLEYYKFTGTKWHKINNYYNKLYLKNSYRVLLTRSRQGFSIFIPKGNDEDKTRLCSFYDGTYKYLKEIGIKEI